MTRVRRFLRLPRAEQVVLVEAILGLTVSGLLLRFWAFRRLASRIGHHMAESPDTAAPPEAALVVHRISEAVRRASRILPWHPVCLPQALTAQWMLRRRGIASTLYLGVDPSAEYAAHAWVRAGTLIVTGGPLRSGFTVVASFA